MREPELKARIEELEAVAEHVPPGVLAARLLVALEDAYQGDLRTLGLAKSFERGGDRPPEPEGFPPPHGEPVTGVPEPPAPASGTVPRFDPGVPQRAADLAADYAAEVAEDLREFPEEPAPDTDTDATGDGQAAQGTKTCKRCGQEKPLSDYGNDVRTADGKARTCGACISKTRREARAARATPRSAPRSAPGGSESEPAEARAETPQQEERRCANGPRCVAADPDDLVPTPAILDAANPDDTCRRCQKRAGL